MAPVSVRGFSGAVLKWLIPVPQGRSTTTGTGRILDLPANRGYRAKEMLSTRTFTISADRLLPVTEIARPQFARALDAILSVFSSSAAVAPNNDCCARS
jgi:hypothetical protein